MLLVSNSDRLAIFIRTVFTARRYVSAIYVVIVCVCVCVCLCARVSVTVRYGINTAKRRITQIMSRDSPGTLVFSDAIDNSLSNMLCNRFNYIHYLIIELSYLC